MKLNQIFLVYIFILFLSLCCCEPSKKAYYILFATDILNSTTWPSQYREYSIFITSPQNITQAIIQKIKTDIPGSIIIAYWDFMDLPIKSGCATGHVMVSNNN